MLVRPRAQRGSSASKGSAVARADHDHGRHPRTGIADAGAGADQTLRRQRCSSISKGWRRWGSPGYSSASRSTGGFCIGAGAILAGALLLSWRGGPAAFGWGALAIAGACVAWGFDNNLTRKLSSVDPVQIATVKGLVAGAVNVRAGNRRRRYAARVVIPGRCGFRRPFRLRREPGSLRARVAPPRYGSHRRLLLVRPVHRCDALRFMLEEPITTRLIVAGLLMATWRLPASVRSTRARARA